ncbi:hypothetical protein D9M71_724720 [compost metagenome]
MAVEDGVPLLVAHLLDHIVPGVAGVVDDDVDAAKVVDRSLDEAVGEIDRRDTAHASDGFTPGVANLGDHFFSGCRIQVVDHHARTVSGQFQRHAASDATAGSCDQRDLTFEFFHGVFLVLMGVQVRATTASPMSFSSPY